jgi:hypothetical protein
MQSRQSLHTTEMFTLQIVFVQKRLIRKAVLPRLDVLAVVAMSTNL